MGALLQTLFASLAGFFAVSMAQRTAMGLAAIAVFAALTAAFMSVIAAAISAVLFALPVSPAWTFGFWYFMPENLPACASAVISAHIASALYKINVYNLQFLHNSA